MRVQAGGQPQNVGLRNKNTSFVAFRFVFVESQAAPKERERERERERGREREKTSAGQDERECDPRYTE